MSVDTVPIGASFPNGFDGRDTKLGSFQNNQMSYQGVNPDYLNIYGIAKK